MRDFSPHPAELRNPIKLPHGLHTEANLSANSIKQRIRRLLHTFGIPESGFAVFLREDRNATGEDSHRLHALFDEDAEEGDTGNPACDVSESSFTIKNEQAGMPVSPSPLISIPHKAMMICVNQTAETEGNLYDASRYAWRLDPARASEAEVILATVRGIVRGVYIPHKWLPATLENFPEFKHVGPVPGRYGYIGAPAPKALQDHYLGKRIPARFREKGASNPIMYLW
jgi:hypothetical protein